MPTTQDYLNDLIVQKKKLAKCVSTCVECSEEETLNSIVPKTETALEQAFERGKNSVWDIVQNFGNRTSYSYGFYKWSNKDFSPKYPITSERCDNMFGYFGEGDSEPCDLRKIVLNTSSCTDFAYMFNNANVLAVGELNTTKAPTLNNMFRNAKVLETIEKLILLDDSQTFSNTFTGCSSLKNIAFEGKIFSSVNFSSCTLLTKESIINIINALQPSASACECRISLVAVNKAFETTPGANDGASSTEWAELISGFTGWEIVTV